MTEPKKIKIKKKEEQPFGIEKLRRLATESESFEGYMERVIPELLEIKDEKDGGDNSIQAVYRRIVKELSENYVDSASQSHMSEKQLYNIVTSAVNDQGGQPSSKLIGMVSNTRNQVRNLPKREDLYILCFAIVACGGTVDQCDRLARAGGSEEIHSRELYQLDAREGFFRFVLYWNQRCLFESKQKPMIKTRMITYSQACERYNKEVSISLREKIDAELKELEILLNQSIFEDGKTEFITELMENLQNVKNSTETGNVDLSRVAGLLQNMYKRFSRGETNDDAKIHQGITTAMKHDTSAWTSEVEKLVNNVDLDQNDAFNSACALYAEMAGNFIGEKDWTAVSIIIKAICSDRYRVNEYYFNAKVRNYSINSGLFPVKKSENGEQTTQTRLSRAIVPKKIMMDEETVIARLMNPTLRYISVSQVTTDSYIDSNGVEVLPNQGFIVPDSYSSKGKSEGAIELVSICGLYDSKARSIINGVVTTKRQILLRFGIACNYTAESDYDNILGLSGNNQFISTNRREMFVLSIIVWISQKYTAEKYSKYSMLETVRYAEKIVLFYFAKNYYKITDYSEIEAYKIFKKIIVYVDGYTFEMFQEYLHFYSILSIFSELLSFPAKEYNMYTMLLSGFEIDIPVTNSGLEADFEVLFNNTSCINESEWWNLRDYVKKSLDELIQLLSKYKKLLFNNEGEINTSNDSSVNQSSLSEEKAKSRKQTTLRFNMEQYILCALIASFCEFAVKQLSKTTDLFEIIMPSLKQLDKISTEIGEYFSDVFEAINDGK